MKPDLSAVTLIVADPRPQNKDRCRALLDHVSGVATFGTIKHLYEFKEGKEAYDWLLSVGLAAHFDTEFVMVCQLDGWLTDPEAWSRDFLQYDYIGAPWPESLNRNRIGNGGFSIRSKRLHVFLERQRWEWLPDDVFISNACGRLIVEDGMRFAPLDVAARFSRELPIEETHLVPAVTAGFHGGRVFGG